MRFKAVIFDLDGVICHTDEYHYLAWKAMADSLGVPFDRKYNGTLSQTEKEALAEKKNELYRQYLSRMSPADLSDEVRSTLNSLDGMGLLLAIGSSSKNAPFILRQIGLDGFFDAVSDGNNITRSKPDPEVFLKAAQMLGLEPAQCLVVEDAVSGTRAGHAGGFQVACLGDAAAASAGDHDLASFSELLDLVREEA